MPNVTRHTVGRRVKRKLQLKNTRHHNWKLVYAQTLKPASIGDEVVVDTTAGRTPVTIVGSRAPSGRDPGAVFVQALGATTQDPDRHRQYHPSAVGLRWVRGGDR